MTTPEQQAPIDALISHLDDAATHVKALKAELDAIKGAGEPVAWGQLGVLNGKTYLRENWDRSPYPPPPSIVKNLNLVPLYTRPCVPLTDEQIDSATAAARDALMDHVYEYGTAAEGAQKFVRRLARAIEAAHGITPSCPMWARLVQQEKKDV